MRRSTPTPRTNAEPTGLHGVLPYRGKGRLLSDGELRFYREGLLPAVGERYAVMCKVRLTDVVEVPDRLWRSPAGRKVQQRLVDFVLADKSSLAIAAVVELDDKTHRRAGQRRKDAYLADALHAAGVPLLRAPVYRRYDPAKLRQRVSATLNGWRAKAPGGLESERPKPRGWLRRAWLSGVRGVAVA